MVDDGYGDVDGAGTPRGLVEGLGPVVRLVGFRDGYQMLMDLAERFAAAAGHAYEALAAGAELMPMVLSQACVEVLPVAGAGLSITDRLRVPLGSSDDNAARAERLQATLGEGPCLAATASKSPLTAACDTIAVRWPMFHREFVTQTPFRSVVSLPLLSRRQRLRYGALDLYLTTRTLPDFCEAFLSQVMSAVADPIADVLFGGRYTTAAPQANLPPWLDNLSVAGRMHVWVAVGILIEHAGLGDADALAALRAYAFSHDTTLDDLADELVTQRLEPEGVLA